MAKRRSSPALFELLKEQNALARSKGSDIAGPPAPTPPAPTPAAPTRKGPMASVTSRERASLVSPETPKAKPGIQASPRPEPKPEHRPEPKPREIQLEDPSPGSSMSEGGPGRMLRVPVFTVWIGIAVVIAGGFLLFTAGHQLGQTKKEAEWMAEFGASVAEAPTEVPDLGRSQPRVVISDPDPEPLDAGPASGQPASPPGAGSTSSRPGPFDEQRQVGLNYLTLGVIGGRPEAERLIRWLGDQGVPAMAVELSGSSGNNRSYRVWTLNGITGTAYARRLAARTEHEARVAELGRSWLDDMDGTLDFTRPSELYWKKQRQ